MAVTVSCHLQILATLLLVAMAASFPRRLPFKGWHNLILDSEECSACQVKLCPAVPPSCPAGRVRDVCGCCWECARAEGWLCDANPRSDRVYGLCGEGLVCRAPEGEAAFGLAPEPRCACAKREVLCGTDQKTYRNSCQLREARNSQAEPDLAVAHRGPCKSAPVIVTAPRDILSLEGNDIMFGCEVSSFPVVFVEWRKGGESGALPGDSTHITVQSRGGPQRYEITSWLQIRTLQKEDEGLYTCYTRNQFGETSSSARLRVVPLDSPLAAEVQAYRVGVYGVSDDEDSEQEEGSTSFSFEQGTLDRD
ncbi:kazal-type serine protease inhibitor domain-containing protein 1-like [Ambystoma mexicanum]|uniref:kazal-type serine protease inhibitor domain-containing protein 1-like n=1 Tax=Ambystoma mexicanum TaxID=8296 RepID=UPI0037E88F01